MGKIMRFRRKKRNNELLIKFLIGISIFFQLQSIFYDWRGFMEVKRKMVRPAARRKSIDPIRSPTRNSASAN